MTVSTGTHTTTALLRQSGYQQRLACFWLKVLAQQTKRLLNQKTNKVTHI